jgi:hypothetical protein
MIVEIFRYFFNACAEKHDVDSAKLERIKICIKALADLNKLVCKDVATPLARIYSFLNFLSFDNKKFKKEHKGDKFWGFSFLKPNEKGFDSFEAQANYLLQPLCVALATSRFFLEKLDNENKIFGESSLIYKALNLSSIAEVALTTLYLTRKSLTAKNSWLSLVKLHSEENKFSQALKTQAYQTFLDVQSAALKFCPFITPLSWTSYIKIAQTCVNLLKVPAKLDNYSEKVEKALIKYEKSIFDKLKQLETKSNDLQGFLVDYISLYEKAAHSSNITLLMAFLKTLQDKEDYLKFAAGA